jgi:hypothetical protein
MPGLTRRASKELGALHILVAVMIVLGGTGLGGTGQVPWWQTATASVYCHRHRQGSG